jgi:hypothetical protein
LAGKGVSLAAITIGNDVWFDLSRYGKKHVVRYYTKGSEKRISEPSGHQMWEISIEGSVKWRPKDPSTLNLQNIEPLGPARRN